MAGFYKFKTTGAVLMTNKSIKIFMKNRYICGGFFISGGENKLITLLLVSINGVVMGEEEYC